MSKALLEKIIRIFGYSDSGYASDKGDRKSITGYCTFIEKYLIIWKSKKHDVSRSSAEAKNRTMTHIAYEM